MSKTVPYPLPVAGVDSLSNETALLKGTVREAVNVDVGRAGRFQRRRGFTKVVSGDSFHSFYSALQKGWVLGAQGVVLNRFDPSTMALTPLYTLATSDPLTYTEYNGNVYFSNRSTLGWVPADATTARSVGVPTPPVNPVLSATNGSLTPGKYGVCVSFVDERGEESGTTDVQIIDLPSGGGVLLSGLAQRSDTLYHVYITDPDGMKLHLGAKVPAVFPNYAMSEVAKGGDCDTQFLQPLPPGEFITWLAGRLYTAKNGVLYFSNALRPHLYNPAHNFVQFSGHISFIEAVTDGMYVGDSRGVWFLSGTDPTKFEQQFVSSCRAVKRSSIKMPPEHFDGDTVKSPNPVAVWLSTSGYVVGMDGGITIELQPDRVKVPAGMVGRSAYLFRGGMKQVVTPVNSTSTVAFGTAVDSII